MSNAKNRYSGISGKPDNLALKALRTMKSFSFKALGDGKAYTVKLATTETDKSGDHFLHVFSTVKNEIVTVNVEIPDDLVRWNWSETQVEFIQNNIISFMIQAVESGPFNLRFWDIRLTQ